MAPRPSAGPAVEKPLPSLPKDVDEAPKTSTLLAATEQPMIRTSSPPTLQEACHPNKPRRATAPDIPTTVLPPCTTLTPPPLAYRPRTRSPYARSHARSHSSTSSLSAPQMTRAHSSPIPDEKGRPILRPSSPLDSSASSRRRSPLRRPQDETYSSFSTTLDIDQTISENSELDLTPRPPPTEIIEAVTPSSPSYLATHQTFPRSRRRPSNPFMQSTASSPIAGIASHNTLRATASTPSLAVYQYNEAYPVSSSSSSSSATTTIATPYAISSSSIPSTPTSFRSRSPSISSLETIPDSPDAEQEAEHVGMLKAAADREDDQNEEAGRRREMMGAGVGGGGGGGGGGRAWGGRDKQKRWSVCGAERRGDFNLETIWEA